MIQITEKAIQNVMDKGEFADLANDVVVSLSDINVITLTMAAATVGRRAPSEFTAGYVLAMLMANEQVELDKAEAASV